MTVGDCLTFVRFGWFNLLLTMFCWLLNSVVSFCCDAFYFDSFGVVVLID